MQDNAQPVKSGASGKLRHPYRTPGQKPTALKKLAQLLKVRGN